MKSVLAVVLVAFTFFATNVVAGSPKNAKEEITQLLNDEGYYIYSVYLHEVDGLMYDIVIQIHQRDRDGLIGSGSFSSSGSGRIARDRFIGTVIDVIGRVTKKARWKSRELKIKCAELYRVWTIYTMYCRRSLRIKDPIRKVEFLKKKTQLTGYADADSCSTMF